MFDYFDILTKKIGGEMLTKYFNLINTLEGMGYKRQSKLVEEYALQVPILGFNSGKYDINLVKIYDFMKCLLDRKIEKIFKGNGVYKLIQTEHFRILDARLYCPANFSLDMYISTYVKGAKKFIFPYEKITSFKVLDELIVNLKLEDFNSKLKNNNSLVNHYQVKKYNVQ